jgi:N-acetylglucosamine PTS system EIICBA or EIICB component
VTPPAKTPTTASPLPERTVIEQAPREAWTGDAAALMAALGGSSNVRSVVAAASRVRIGVEDPARVDRAALGALGLRGVALPRPGCVHLIVGPEAKAAAAALQERLATLLA